MEKLFCTCDGNYLTEDDFLRAMEKIKANDADILFIHFGMSFGRPNSELRRNDLLERIYDSIKKLNVKTICFPTFTFSFPNGRDYSVAKSRTKMGALNEYVRKLPEAIRSVDPLMSVSLVGEKKYLVTEIGHESIGKNCTFDLLRREKNVKFMFLGVRPADCFTYTHYVEWALHVPYRYNREFTGNIISEEKSYQDTYTLFVRYRGVEPGENDFEECLLQKQAARKEMLGDCYVYCVDEDIAYSMLCEKIKHDINYMLSNPYPHKLEKKFLLSSEMLAL